MQKGLLGIQFLLSIMVIIVSITINNQLDYIRSRNLGMNPEGVINIPLYTAPKQERLETLKNELKKINSVVNVAASSFVPGNVNWNQTVSWDGMTSDQQENNAMYIIAIDRDFVRNIVMVFPDPMVK